MSADILAVPHLNVRFTREVQEDGGEGEENQVEILDEEEHLGSQKATPHAQKNPAVVNRRYFKAAAVTLGGMYLLILAGIIIRFTLEKDQLQANYNKLSKNYSELSNNYSELEGRFSDVAVNNSQLQRSYETLSKYHDKLQDEVKQLKDKIEGKWCPVGWKRFGCSCYYKSYETKTWSDSRIHCQNNGADLVVINNKEEQEFVTKLNQKGQSWIGLWAIQTGTRWTWQWQWVDGSPLTETFWASGQPQDSGTIIQCTAINKDNGQEQVVIMILITSSVRNRFLGFFDDRRVYSFVRFTSVHLHATVNNLVYTDSAPQPYMVQNLVTCDNLL